MKAEPPATPWVCAPGQQQPAGLQSFVIVLGVNGLHASAANLWTVQQPGTKALNFKVYIAPCWDLCVTVTSGLSVFPPPPECWWEADSAGVPGGLKGRPLYCSGAVTLWWTCVIVEGKWGFNGRSMHFFPHGRFSISGYAPALSEYQSYCNKKRARDLDRNLTVSRLFLLSVCTHELFSTVHLFAGNHVMLRWWVKSAAALSSSCLM